MSKKSKKTTDPTEQQKLEYVHKMLDIAITVLGNQPLTLENNQDYQSARNYFIKAKTEVFNSIKK